MNKISYWLRNFFGFSRQEIGGFSVLTLIIMLAISAPFLFGLIPAEVSTSRYADIRKLDSLKVILEKPQDTKTAGEKIIFVSNSDNAALKPFNPNELSIEGWQAYGLPKSLAQRIINYRQKGGKFRTKNDLMKIYGFPAAIYQKLESSILLPDTLAPSHNNPAKLLPVAVERPSTSIKAEKTIRTFDLNTADSSVLVQIKGIGPGLSRRIMNYRNKLGGFYSINQVREVYGLDSTVVNELLVYAFVKDPEIQKLALNLATAQELSAHPYITPKIAHIMVDYRTQHGNYTSIESLYKIRALDRATLDKVAPYLSFE